MYIHIIYIYLSCISHNIIHYISVKLPFSKKRRTGSWFAHSDSSKCFVHWFIPFSAIGTNQNNMDSRRNLDEPFEKFYLNLVQKSILMILLSFRWNYSLAIIDQCDKGKNFHQLIQQLQMWGKKYSLKTWRSLLCVDY